MSFNKVVILGNLTRDPELRTLSSGTSIARLSVAVNRAFTDKAGAKKEEVTFVEVDSFGKTAEVIAKFFSKGKPILIEGRLKLDQWDDKTTGEKKSRLGVVLETFSFVGSNGERSDRERGDERPSSRRASPAPNTSAAPDDGDVPF